MNTIVHSLHAILVLQSFDADVQIEGRLPRWQLFHHVHLISRTLKRMPPCSALAAADSAPGSPGWHVLNRHLGWLLPLLLQITWCLHSLYSPQVHITLLTRMNLSCKNGV